MQCDIIGGNIGENLWLLNELSNAEHVLAKRNTMKKMRNVHPITLEEKLVIGYFLMDASFVRVGI